MSVQTLVGPTSHEGFKFNFVPLLPIALSVFCLSGLAFYHVELSGTGVSSGVFQALVVGLYQILGFVPAFMLFLLVLSWSSIWFITGSLAEPGARLGRLLLLTLALSILVNLQPEMGPAASHSGVIGHFLASRLESIFGYTLGTLLVAPLALVSLLLATDFFFYRYFETLGRSPVPESIRTREHGVEEEATETLKTLRFSETPPVEPETGPVHGVMPEPVELVVAEEDPAPAARGARRVFLDVDEEIPWEPEEPMASSGQPTAQFGAGVDVVEDPAAEEESEEVVDEPSAEEAGDETGEWEEKAGDDREEDADDDPEEGDYDEEEEEYEEEEEEEYEEDDAEYEEEEEGDLEEEDEEYEEEEDVELSAEEEEEYEEEDEQEEVIDLSLDEPEPLQEPYVPPETERTRYRSRRRAPTRLGEGGARDSEEGEGAEQLIMFLDEADPEEEPEEEERVAEEKIALIPRPTGAPGLVDDARELVLETGRVSASFLQRRLRVDFDEAMHLLRALRVQGIIRIGDNETHGSLV